MKLQYLVTYQTISKPDSEKFVHKLSTEIVNGSLIEWLEEKQSDESVDVAVILCSHIDEPVKQEDK